MKHLLRCNFFTHWSSFGWTCDIICCLWLYIPSVQLSWSTCYIVISLRCNFFTHSVTKKRKSSFGISENVVWPSKVTRHVVPLIGEFELPSRRFEHIDIDLVTMPISNGFRYLFTAVDRFTRWPIPVPLGELRLSSYDCGISNFVRSTVLSNLL